MFQGFTATTRPEQGPPRLAALRDAMLAEGLDAFLVPRADAHQGEYVAPHDERLAWLTGFTGSAGFAVVTSDEAGLFVDGRYQVQVKTQVAECFTPVDGTRTKPGPWLAERLGEGAVVGIDPWLHTAREIDKLVKSLPNCEMRPVDNLVDRIWEDQPASPVGTVAPYPEALAGEAHEDKRARIAEGLRADGHAWAVLTLPDSIAWLLNIRGSDIAHTPVAHGFAVIESETAEARLFMDARKLDRIGDHLGPAVTVLPPGGFIAALRALSGPVRVDPATAPEIVGRSLTEAGVEIAWAEDPCILPKATKTTAEVAATTEAHLRDAAAMCEFLCWLDTAIDAGEPLTEIGVVRALEGFRRATNVLREISFDTIAGAGPHGAIVHYRVTEETDRRIAQGDLLLVDSGGQYEDGTTDITRTVPVGAPTNEQRAAFIRVLQGMIAISRARWPKGLAGRDLDALARAALWRAGQDYDHGTGHGVGVYLGVHEGPQRISRLGEVPLAPGMILSNEPGYYREGEWGIRIENLVVVAEAPALPTGDPKREMLEFSTLTWVPIDRRLIDPAMLSGDERAWLNTYHAAVADKLDGRLSAEASDWLSRAARPI